MISLKEALEIVLGAVPRTRSEPCSLNQAPGRVLAEDVYSDGDMPPFHKSAVDGFACRRADLVTRRGSHHLQEHPPSLQITETISAGIVPKFPVGPKQCARIMTGAMVPEGADTVIMVEDTREMTDGTVRLLKTKSETNICARGEDIRKGDIVLKKGTLLLPPHIAMLASVGAVTPLVSRQPRIAILSTGDELVKPSQTPPPAMIRNSNSSQLAAQVEQLHLKPFDLGISRDIQEDLHGKIREGMETADVLLLSGGVSMGDYDYVPGIMQQLGIGILFQSIAIQPGRPTVFGKKGNRFVFGLPGNPVSSFVLFEILVKPFLYKWMGHDFTPHPVRLPMGIEYIRRKSTRLSILPVRISKGEIFPVEYHGSGHIHSYTLANGMIFIERGTTKLKKGELQDVRLL